MGCKVNQKINPFGFVGARLANGVLKNDTDIEFCSVFPSPLPAPIGVTATIISSSEIDVSWIFTGDISKVSQFQIDRSLDGVDWAFGGITPSNTLVFNDTGRTPETTYFYRVIAIAIPPDTNSIPSNTTSDTTLSANPLDLFGSNLHAWFRADDVILSSGNSVSQLNDKSGNNRHLAQPLMANQPTQEDSTGVYAGLKTIRHAVGQSLLNNTNWTGLGTDPYFVIAVVDYFFNINNTSLGRMYGTNDTTIGSDAHSLSTSTSTFGYRIAPQAAIGGFFQSPSGAGNYNDNSVLMLPYRFGNEKIWRSGTEFSPSSNFNVAVTTPFNLIETSIGYRQREIPFLELMFIKGEPEDYGLANGNAVNELHTGYLSEEYTGLTINNPNIP